MFIKSRFNRLRPCDIYKDVPILIRRPMGSSLPSGHTASSFASATILLHMNYKIGLIALALAFIISFSRLYLFVHFPSDVLFGLLSGIAVAVNQYSNCITFDLKKNRRRFIVCVGSFLVVFMKSLSEHVLQHTIMRRKRYIGRCSTEDKFCAKF